MQSIEYLVFTVTHKIRNTQQVKHADVFVGNVHTQTQLVFSLEVNQLNI